MCPSSRVTQRQMHCRLRYSPTLACYIVLSIRKLELTLLPLERLLPYLTHINGLFRVHLLKEARAKII